MSVVRSGCAVLTLFLAGAALAEEPNQRDSPPASAESATNDAKPAGTSSKDMPTAESVEKLAERVRKSLAVVTVAVRDGRSQGIGSGFAISADGLIATNLHVIGEARPISVQMADGRTLPVVAVHATDRGLDLAILRVESADLSPLPLGDSDQLQQGQPVVGFGNPHGLKNSVVTGVVSGIREFDGRPMIQLAMPIEPGNSGGPLLDMQGRVQGILTMKSAVTANLCFAATVNTLKPLVERPNPVPLARWLTIGALDPRDWSTRLGARWRQRAGRIAVDGSGQGFGGRALCLSEHPTPELPYELAVTVKLDDEAGAAGLAFGCDEDNLHYGFYPTAGKLRLTRFAGPDVLSWTVLRDEPSPHYVPGDWNTLRVRLEQGKLLCYVNQQLLFEQAVDLSAGGKVGLAKFRDTRAEFKRFQVAKEIAADATASEAAAAVQKLIEQAPAEGPLGPELISALVPQAALGAAALRDRAGRLERQAGRLRAAAQAVHEQSVLAELATAVAADDDQIDLCHVALLIARLDNDEVDVEAYRALLRRMADDLKRELPADASEEFKRIALRKFLFEQNGFHGSRGDYYNRANSYLNEVLDDREGLPITLSVLYLELARGVGLNVEGVGLPGHFIVRHVPREGEPQLIDVFDAAAPLSHDDAKVKVREFAGRELQDQDLATTGSRAIAVRLVRNLLGIAMNDANNDAVLRYLDAILTIDADSAPDRWMRAVVAFRGGRRQTVAGDLDWLLMHKPDGIDLDQVHELRNALDQGPR